MTQVTHDRNCSTLVLDEDDDEEEGSWGAIVFTSKTGERLHLAVSPERDVIRVFRVEKDEDGEFDDELEESGELIKEIDIEVLLNPQLDNDE